MAHVDAREGKWRISWRMEWVASTLHTTSEHGVSSIPTADAHTSAASSRLNWRPRRFKWTRPFAERRNLASARVPSHFKRSLPILCIYFPCNKCKNWARAVSSVNLCSLHQIPIARIVMVTSFLKSWLFIVVDTQVTSRGGGVSEKNLLEIILTL